tara:strand:- start:3428 stop:4498 length:1071 start_codon:yes stop_codon:yes gene_type:complete
LNLKDTLQFWAIGQFMSTIVTSPEQPIANRKEADKRLDLLGRLAVFRAGLSGLLSGLIVVSVALFLKDWEGAAGLSGWGFIAIITVVSSLTTALELVFLYRDSLSTAARMAKILNIPDEELFQAELENSIPHWLVHAALGAPGFQGTMFGIDPLAKIGKVGMILRKILKKLRIIASATVFKMILRRMWVRLLGRVALRAYVELISLPVFILLNMFGMNTMMNDMRSRLVGHEFTPKLVNHAFPEGLDDLEPGLRSALHSGIKEQITTARFIHPNQIRVLELLGAKDEELVAPDDGQKRRANRFLLAVFSMSGKNSSRCKKLIRRIELELGTNEVELVHQEIEDAIYDLTPLKRAWT